MDRTPIALSISLVVILALVAGTGWLLYAFPEFSIELAKGRNIVFGIVAAFLLGPAWIAYGRLSVFDSMDELDARHRSIIGKHASSSRKRLLIIFVAVAAMLFFTYVVLAAAEKVPFVASWIWLIAPVLCAGFFFLMVQVIALIFAIEADRIMVNELRRKEEARVKLIEQLQKDRKEFPISPDPHLTKFNNLLRQG